MLLVPNRKLMKMVGLILVFGVSWSCQQASPEIAELSSEGLNQSRSILIKNLKNVQDSGRFVFGQQSYNLMGKTESGSTNILWEDTNLLDSPSKEVVGDDPGVLGIDVHYFSTIPNENAHKQTAKAVKSHIDKGGVVAFDWHMRGCFSDDSSSKGMYTNVEKYGDQGATKENNKCICAIANNWQVKDGIDGKDWINERVDKFAKKVKDLGSYYASKGMVFRPFHEHTGNWFWWHEPFWDCSKFDESKSTENLLSGAEAYKAVFRHTVSRLRNDNQLPNFLVAYSPDKLYVSGWDYSVYPPASKDDKSLGRSVLQDKYLEALPKDVVDIYGFDIYDPTEVHGGVGARSVALVSELAQYDGKIAAITEVGSYQIDNGKKAWFMDDLLSKTVKGAKLAFMMTWENRAKSYVPVSDNLDKTDFVRFYENERTLFASDIGNLLEEENTFTYVDPSKAICVDPDGDGYGWDGTKSCEVSSKPTCVDPDGDGYGWDGTKSCEVSSKPICLDPDGDGYGWDGTKSCKM